MLNFIEKTTQRERIKFGYKDIRNIGKDNSFFNEDRPGNVQVKSLTIEQEKKGRKFVVQIFL
jgi:hypothetical protein